MLERKGRPPCSKRLWVAATVALMLVLSLPAAADSRRVKKRNSAIRFINDLDNALEQAPTTGKPIYLTLGYAWYGSDAVYGLELETTQATVLAAGEWRFKPRMSLVMQLLGTQGVATDLGVFSETSNEIVLGWKWEVRQAGVLEIGLLENIIEFDNSPDFGVHAAWTQRF